MQENNHQMQNNCRSRVTISRSNVNTEAAVFTFQNEKSAEIFDNENVISTEMRNYQIINGECIHDASEVSGQHEQFLFQFQILALPYSEQKLSKPLNCSR